VGEGSAAGVVRPSAWADPEVRRFVDERLSRIREAFAPEAVLLFGSRVRGQSDRWSDIDLVIVSKRFAGMHALDRMRLFDEEIRPHRHVDALCYTPEEFALKASQPTIVAEAVREGIRII